jgi:dihydrofolate synthase/folylpolyglutamate synthase
VVGDGEVSDEALAQALERALSAKEAARAEGTAGSEATWFDVLTTAAFAVFSEARVEWAVVECGLGGRLDSTNVVRGEVCVVTNVDLEHTRVLGSTRAAIAREKGGILKPGSSLVTGCLVDSELSAEDDPARVLSRLADAHGCRRLAPSRIAPTLFERNVDLAELVLDELGRRGVRGSAGELVSAALLDQRARDQARLPARAERRVRGGTRVVFEVAHVPASVRAVLEELARDPSLPGRPVVVLALGRDKDLTGILKALAGHADRLVCTTVASGPLREAEELRVEASRAGCTAEAEPDPERAFARALGHARDERWVLVLGSFYLAGALRSDVRPHPPDERQ